MATDSSFKRPLWIGVGVIGASIIAAIVAFYYFSGAIAAQAEKVAAIKSAAETDASAVASLAALENDAPQAEAYSTALSKLLPDQSGLIGFNAWAQAIGGRYGVTVTVTYQGDPVPATPATPGTADFTMVATGPRGSTAAFLDDLAGKRPGFIMSFSSLDFTNDGSQETLTAQGTLYFR